MALAKTSIEFNINISPEKRLFIEEYYNKNKVAPFLERLTSHINIELRNGSEKNKVSWPKSQGILMTVEEAILVRTLFDAIKLDFELKKLR